MKKLNIYYSTIFWTSVLTGLVGCSYYRANNLVKSNYHRVNHMVQGISGLFKSKGAIEQNNILPNLTSGNGHCSIYTIIYKWSDHITKCMEDIQENRSSFNEENFNRFIKEFDKFLNNNTQKFKNGSLFSPPMIHYSNPSTNQEPVHLIKNAQQYMISQSNDRATKDSNRAYLLSLKNKKKSLLAKIHETEELLSKEDPDALQLLAEEIKEMIGQENRKKNWISILLPFMHGRCYKVDKKDKNTAIKSNDSILDSFLNCHYKLVNLLIIHAFNENICKGVSNKKKAEEEYGKISKLITGVYDFTSISNSYEMELTKLLKKTGSSDNLAKIPDYNDIKIINTLSKDYFKSINKKMNKVSSIINLIPYYSDPFLKEKLTKIFKVWYGIISIYIMIGILLDFSTIRLFCRPELTGSNSKETIYSIQYAWKTLALERYGINMSKYILFNDNSAKEKIDRLITTSIAYITHIIKQPTMRKCSINCVSFPPSPQLRFQPARKKDI